MKTTKNQELKFSSQQEMFSSLFVPCRSGSDENDNRKVFTTTSIALVVAANTIIVFALFI